MYNLQHALIQTNQLKARLIKNQINESTYTYADILEIIPTKQLI